MVDRQTFRDLFLQASNKQVYLIDSKYSGEYLYDLSQKYSFDNNKDILLCRTVSEIILGFYKVEDTVPLLQQELGIDAKTAALLGADVLDFLAPLSDPNFVVPTDTVEDESEPTAPPTNSTWTPPVSAPQPVASPIVSVPNVAPEIHTMASDANVARGNFEPVVEQVYSSEQPAMRKTLSDTPSYASPFDQSPRDTTPKAPIEPPRWGV